jgi:hypothetical protein
MNEQAWVNWFLHNGVLLQAQQLTQLKKHCSKNIYIGLQAIGEVNKHVWMVLLPAPSIIPKHMDIDKLHSIERSSHYIPMITTEDKLHKSLQM